MLHEPTVTDIYNDTHFIRFIYITPHTLIGAFQIEE